MFHFLKSYICSNQLDVQKNCCFAQSTESEIISLDPGLRLDGLLALELWNLIVSVSGSATQTSDRTGRPVDTERSHKSQRRIDVMKDIDSVPSNVQSLRIKELCYMCSKTMKQ